MKTLAEQIQDVRAFFARHCHMVPGASSYIMQLDGITHEVAELERAAREQKEKACAHSS